MGWSVLVVDDEPMTQDLLRMMLEPVGFDVSGADDGIDALEKVAHQRPDAMILDIMMPRLDGYSVCRRLRSRPETADLPIIILTGMYPYNEAEGRAAGADRFMIKPMSRNDLIRNLREMLGERHA